MYVESTLMCYRYYSITNGYPKLNGEVAKINGLLSKCDISGNQLNDNHDYENLVMKPTRPAPSIPNSANQCASNAYCQGEVTTVEYSSPQKSISLFGLDF